MHAQILYASIPTNPGKGFTRIAQLASRVGNARENPGRAECQLCLSLNNGHCLRDEKKALMQQLLTGKRRVKVDEAVAE